MLDSRLYDLLPDGPLPGGMTAIGYETLGVGGRGWGPLEGELAQALLVLLDEDECPRVGESGDSAPVRCA